MKKGWEVWGYAVGFMIYDLRFGIKDLYRLGSLGFRYADL